jgi:hypothetical protein
VGDWPAQVASEESTGPEGGLGIRPGFASALGNVL